MSRIDQLFLAAVSKVPDRAFVRHRHHGVERVTTYRDAAGVVSATASALVGAGITKGSRVICLLDDIEPSIYLMLACACAGIVFVPAAGNTSAGALDNLKRRVDARAILTDRAHAPDVARDGTLTFSFGLAGDKPTSASDKVIVRPAAGTADALEALSRLVGDPGRSDEDPYVILMTSGSTGEPKLVIRSHRSFADYALLRMEDYGPGPHHERHLLCSGLQHGLAHTSFSLALAMQSEICVPSEMEGKTGLDDVVALDPTLSQMSPRVVKALQQQHLARGGDPRARFFGPSFRSLRTAGSSIPQELLGLLAAQGIDVGEFYGTTETSHVAHTIPGHWRAGWVGQVPSCVEVKIDDDGELLVRTPFMMSGYLGDEEGTRAVFTPDGFYKSGDIGEVDGERFLRVLGRKKDIFNAPDGTNLFPARIEEAIMKLPWARQAVLFGDGRPFLAAIISIAENGEPDGDGALPPRTNAAVYERAARDLAALNAKTEPVERVRRFVLFGGATKLYEQTQLGKPMLHRKKMIEKYARQVELLYAASPGEQIGVVAQS